MLYSRSQRSAFIPSLITCFAYNSYKTLLDISLKCDEWDHNSDSDGYMGEQVSLQLGLVMCSKCSFIYHTFILEILFPLFHLW